MRQAIVDNNTRAAFRIDATQGAIDLDLAGCGDHNQVMQGEKCPQSVVASDDGNFVILDDSPTRYSDTLFQNSDSDAYLEGCIRILQCVAGQVRRTDLTGALIGTGFLPRQASGKPRA